MNDFEKLISVAKRKAVLDQNNDWFDSSMTYISATKDEVDEVVVELPRNRKCFLEDELADVLWDYISALVSLENENKVSLSSVVTRTLEKYEERIDAIEKGELWTEIKKKQRTALLKEQSLESNT